MISALRQAFMGHYNYNRISHTKEHTPGRLQTLRDNGWDGVKGTHKEVKYRKLEKLQSRLKEAQDQASEYRERRNQASPASRKWGRLNRRMKEFENHADHLQDRIDRQKEYIEEQEGS